MRNHRVFLKRPCSVLIAAVCIAGLGACSGDDAGQTSAATGSTGAAGAGGGSESIVWGPCPSGFQTECATVQLPLDWNDPAGQEIPIFLSRQPASSGTSNAQLWLLMGGPGQSGEIFGQLIDELSPSLPDVDFYVLEHRGVGDSSRLGCPVEESPASPGGTSLDSTEWITCIDSLKMQWGDGLNQFTISNDGRDLGRLIERTRGPDQKVFVYGVSYGTTRAMRFLQTSSAAVDGVILDSVVAPGIQFLSDLDLQWDPVVQEFATLCATDAVCGAKMGADPWAAVTAAMDKLDNTTDCAALGASTKAKLKLYLTSFIASRSLRAHIFPLLYRLNRCDPADVQVITHHVSTYETVLNSATSSGRASMLTQVHITLSELWKQPWPAYADLQAACDAVYFCPGTASFAALYPYWPPYPRDQYTDKWPVTTVPVLSMNGTLDPATPIALAQQTQDHLNSPNQTFVAIPDATHVLVFNSPVKTTGAPHCAEQMIAGFVNNPQAPIDTSCISDLERMSFTDDPADIQMFFGVADMWENTTPFKVPDEPAPSR